MKQLLIFTFFLCLLLPESAAKGYKNYFVTPEQFGCISDDIKKADHNSKRLQKMVDYAAENGLKIVANGNKKYYISKGIIITKPVIIDFNRALLVATDTTDMILINHPNLFNGIISGLRLDLNNIAKSGIFCDNVAKLHIHDCWIYGIKNNSQGLLIEKGYEILVDNMHFQGGDEGAVSLCLGSGGEYPEDRRSLQCGD